MIQQTSAVQFRRPVDRSEVQELSFAQFLLRLTEHLLEILVFRSQGFSLLLPSWLSS
jgi:hypothetical protein